MTRKNWLFTQTLLAVGALLFAMTAMAGSYMGIGFGNAQSTLDRTFRGQDLTFIFDRRPEFQLQSFSDDDSDSALKLFGGYQFSNNMIIEYGYLDLGSHQISGAGSIDSNAVNVGNPTPPIITERFERNIELKGVFASYGYARHISEKVSIKPKVGAYIWDLEGTFRSDNNIQDWGSYTRVLDTSGTSVILGIGMGIGDFSVEFEYIPVRDDEINYFGVSYKF